MHLVLNIITQQKTKHKITRDMTGCIGLQANSIQEQSRGRRMIDLKAKDAADSSVHIKPRQENIAHLRTTSGLENSSRDTSIPTHDSTGQHIAKQTEEHST